MKLSGEDGNAFSIMGRISSAMRRAGIPKEEIIDAFLKEATADDDNHLLQTSAKWVDVH